MTTAEEALLACQMTGGLKKREHLLLHRYHLKTASETGTTSRAVVGGGVMGGSPLPPKFYRPVITLEENFALLQK